MKRIVFLFCLCLSFHFMMAQGNPWYPEEDTIPKKKGDFWHSRENFAKSITLTGGYEQGGFKIGIVKFGYEYKHWGGGIDIFRQQYHIVWDEGDVAGKSEGTYRLNGFGAYGRFYMSKIARNAYVEIGAGAGEPKITVKYSDGKTKYDKWKMQFFQFGGGWRLGFRPKGFFGEVGYRGYLSLHRLPLLNTDYPNIAKDFVFGKEGKPVQYHLWYIRKYRLMNQVTVGLGYSF